MQLEPGEEQGLLRLARQAIRARFTGDPVVPPELTPAILAPYGAFVTLHSGGDLRGCVGYIHVTTPLWQNVQRAAESSAFRDTRFPPVRRDELGGIEIEVSVLSAFERVDDPGRVVPGKHGVLVRQGLHTGLLLPQVATERNWDRETFLRHTCLKAGLDSEAWRETATEIEVFSALVFNEAQYEETG